MIFEDKNAASKLYVLEKRELWFWGKAPNPGKKTTLKIIVPEQKELYFLGKLPTLAKNNFKDYCIVPEQKELYLMGRLPTLEGTQLQKLKFRRKKKRAKKQVQRL